MRKTPVLSLRCLAVLWAMLLLQLSTKANVHQLDFKVTLKAEQVALKNVMKDIEKQTGLYFMYSPAGLKINDPVTISVTNAKLEDVLETLMTNRGISWSIIDKAIVLKVGAVKNRDNTKESMFRTVNGAVFDHEGQPLPGATVQIKGTNIGATTSRTGGFSIANVPAKQLIIQARYTGYEPAEKPLGSDGIVEFHLKPSVSNLDEAVVVAYGTSSQRSVTGALSVVKGEEIKTLPNRSFDKSLQGLVPGMRVSSGTGQPGGGVSNMIVRGISTGTEALGGSTVRNPLIIIDGMQVNQDPFNRMGNQDPYTSVTNPLAQINPDDIAEITVLKDAAAIALYGSKASNGVLLVTTKKGKVGNPRFAFSHQTDLGFRPSNHLKMLNQQQYLELLLEAYRNADPSLTDAAIRSELYTKFPYRTSGGDTSFYQEPDWQHEVYNSPAVTLSNNLSISGGTPAQIYYLNFEYTKQNGLIKNSGYDRASFRINVDNTVSDWLKFGISSLLSYNVQNIQGDQENAVSGAGLASVISPLLPVRRDDGSYIPTYSWGTFDGLEKPNPVLQLERNYNTIKAYRALSSMHADLSFLRHFSFTSLLGIDFMQTENKTKMDPRFQISNNGMIWDYDVRDANVIWTNSLKYQTQIGRHHHLELLGVYESQIQQRKLTSLMAVGGKPNVDPYYDDISSPDYILNSYTGTNSRKTMLSQLVQASYDFRKKYYLTASWRRDGASVFGDANPFGNYWSAGGAWIISEEPVFRNLKDVVQFLKIRGSVGIAGNSAAISGLSRYEFMRTAIYLNQPILIGSTSTPGNPDIKWEKTRQWNAGLQASLLNNRLTVEGDLYYKFTKDLIYNVSIPSFTGYSLVMDNIGDIRNSGIEVSASASLLRNKNFRWTMRGNWSRNTNKLVRSNKTLNSISNIIANEEGREFNSYYMPVWAGVNSENGMPQWLDSSGKATREYHLAKKEFVGKTQPDGYGSLINVIGWKGLELSFMFYYQYGGELYNELENQLLTDGKTAYHNSPVSALDRWQKPGDVAANPKRILANNSFGSQVSTRYLQKSDYLRFQNIRLNWLLPRTWTSAIKMQQINIYTQVNNIAFWSLSKSVDPDQINPGGSIAFAYPMARTYSFGLNASF